MRLSIRNQQRAFRLDRPLLAKVLRRALRQSGLTQRLQAGDELALIAVSEAEITALNERFLAHSGSTDVITFDFLGEAPSGLPGDSRCVGEIYVCPEVAERAAAGFGNSLGAELALYVVHGVLHLAGQDDATAAARAAMRRAEAAIMQPLAAALPLAGAACRR